MSAVLDSPPALGKETVNQPCEVCGGRVSRPWRSLRYPQFGQPGRFELRRCAGCALVFNSPRLVPAALSRLYDRNYYIFSEPVNAAYDRVRQLHAATVAQLEQRVPRGPILEVGSAKGYMLSLLRDRGWQAQGVELSAHAARFANEVLGSPTFCGTVEDWVRRPDLQPVPVAYCTDVIEHVPSPRAFLQALHAAVQPGGWLLVGTPNIDSEGVTRHGDHWLGFNPFHIWLFSRQTLSALLESCGFEVVQAYSFGNAQLEREPELPPLKRLARDLLGRAGLLNTVRRWVGGAQEQLAVEEVTALRQAAGQRLAQAPAWTDTEDGRHARAQTCKGDNLVVIARRRTSAEP